MTEFLNISCISNSNLLNVKVVQYNDFLSKKQTRTLSIESSFLKQLPVTNFLNVSHNCKEHFWFKCFKAHWAKSTSFTHHYASKYNMPYRNA